MTTTTELTNEKISEAIKLANTLLDEKGMNTGRCEEWSIADAKEWEKEEKHNIYINLNYGRTVRGATKWKRGVTYCINLKTGTVSDISNKYNNAHENKAICQIANQVKDFLFS